MNLAVLFSGGKDSYLALEYASKEHQISCLLTLESKKEDSWMFHTPAIEWTKLQAEAMKIEHLILETSGVKEEELDDLQAIIKSAISKYSIEGIVTGALASVYQSTRVQKICNDLDLWCFNPLWQMPQQMLLQELLSNNIESIITGVAAEPFDDQWLGRSIDSECVSNLMILESKYGINPAGEGGEIESFVTNASLFSKSIKISKSEKHYSNFSGRLEILEAFLQ
ncbi:MAG TPA: diphthine--ammonia ligase [Candidatus Poseidoniia archaeon]|jgi:ABC transporter with metal-binding/Fe-S-binding domain ATP-binding protein|nr:diphthine--ammonia ligase [Candidatus Poseidoniia archaeon]|tara:strand:- start:1449 stop:2123 length:675 start_codon:yes stop_codon:yes gene_type:complete